MNQQYSKNIDQQLRDDASRIHPVVPSSLQQRIMLQAHQYQQRNPRSHQPNRVRFFWAASAATIIFCIALIPMFNRPLAFKPELQTQIPTVKDFQKTLVATESSLGQEWQKLQSDLLLIKHHLKKQTSELKPG